MRCTAFQEGIPSWTNRSTAPAYVWAVRGHFGTRVLRVVSKAYLYPFSIRHVFVQIADADWGERVEGLCGKLNVSMHWAIDATLNWRKHWPSVIGWTQPPSSKVTFMYILSLGEEHHNLRAWNSLCVQRMLQTSGALCCRTAEMPDV